MKKMVWLVAVVASLAVSAAPASAQHATRIR